MFKKQQMTLKIAKISKAIEKIDGDMKFVGHEIKLRNPNQTLSKWFLKKKKFWCNSQDYVWGCQILT